MGPSYFSLLCLLCFLVSGLRGLTEPTLFSGHLYLHLPLLKLLFLISCLSCSFTSSLCPNTPSSASANHPGQHTTASPPHSITLLCFFHRIYHHLTYLFVYSVSHPSRTQIPGGQRLCLSTDMSLVPCIVSGIG